MRVNYKDIVIVFVLYFGLSTNSSLFGQTRKYISQFSHLQGYFNPGLTGYEASMLRAFVRNQWVGWDGAPKTYFFSAELDFAEAGGFDPVQIGNNAVGFTFLSDTYGPFRENEITFSYSSRIRISQFASLRLGAGIDFKTMRLDGNNLTTEQVNDPIISVYQGRFVNTQVLDFSLGFALTHPNYYLSYAVKNVNMGRITFGDDFLERRPRVGLFQSGYRNSITKDFDLAVNGMWRYQNNLPDNIELNLKALFLDKFWVGVGHRITYSNNFQLGFLFDKMRFGYVYEMPLLKSYLLPNVTHEFMLSFSIFNSLEASKIW